MATEPEAKTEAEGDEAPNDQGEISLNPEREDEKDRKRPREEDTKDDKAEQNSKLAKTSPKLSSPPEDEDENANNADAPKKKSKHTPKKKMDPKVLDLRWQIQNCCKRNDLKKAMSIYQANLSSENPIRIESSTFYSLLNLCDGIDRNVHVGTPKPPADKSPDDESPAEVEHVDFETRRAFAFSVRERMGLLKFPLNESSCLALVRLLSHDPKYFPQAEEIVDEAERTQQCKLRLRLYSSLLLAYCDHGDMMAALKIWKRLAIQQGKQPSLAPTEKEFTALLECSVKAGNSLVFEKVLSLLAEDVTIPSKDTVSAILTWYNSAHAKSEPTDTAATAQLLKEIFESAKIGEDLLFSCPVVDARGWTTSSACDIDPKTGTLATGCLAGHKLQPVPLSARMWEDMKTMNETIVMDGQLQGNDCPFLGGKKGRKRKVASTDERKQKWDEFNEFLGTFKETGLDVVIDGANVGYYKTNFAGAPTHVDYSQIDWIVKHFTKLGKRVLLVLHQRHFSNRSVPAEAKGIVASWETENILYKSPAGMNDDWFWLHAALEYETLVITNDEMRDHHFQMLAPRMFLHWKSRHQIHFDFGTWTHGGGEGDVKPEDGSTRRVELIMPDPYSRRIQRIEDGLVVPLAKKGDENRFLDGLHVANDDEPVEETYICIRPSQSTPSDGNKEGDGDKKP